MQQGSDAGIAEQCELAKMVLNVAIQSNYVESLLVVGAAEATRDQALEELARLRHAAVEYKLTWNWPCGSPSMEETFSPVKLMHWYAPLAEWRTVQLIIDFSQRRLSPFGLTAIYLIGSRSTGNVRPNIVHD